ncbi:hypothetical protein RC1_1866 [Rhodospirillum centenum SW]|uniref:Uncharacterized protein n=2 Tax=Rhodospirillum centenum TaxID=34018 RepID=B6INS8_RHOCS|nr:hypothetical protein RC1_1866 [Rhodospirillum centenum SW]
MEAGRRGLRKRKAVAGRAAALAVVVVSWAMPAAAGGGGGREPAAEIPAVVAGRITEMPAVTRSRLLVLPPTAGPALAEPALRLDRAPDRPRTAPVDAPFSGHGFADVGSVRMGMGWAFEGDALSLDLTPEAARYRLRSRIELDTGDVVDRVMLGVVMPF